MQRNRFHVSKFNRRRSPQRQSGVALVTALILLLLLTGLSLAMVMSVRSDLFINGYYRNFRGSFYAADSGLNVMRQDLVNQLNAAIPATFTPNTQPVPAGTEGTIQTYIKTTYGSSFSLAGSGTSGTPAASYPETFTVDPALTTFTLTSCIPSGGGGGGTCTTPIGNPSTYTYVYAYTLGSIGSAQGGQKTELRDEGSLTFNVTVTAASSHTTTNASFAAWGLFFDQNPICDGSVLIPGTVSGPVFSNDTFNFGVFSTKYIFTDNVGTASANVGYDFGNKGGSCDQKNTTSDSQSGNTIAPTFQNGLSVGQNKIPLPGNSYNQEQAVIDGIGTASGAVTPAALNASVKNINQTAYPSGGAASGVYLPYKTVDSLGHPLNPPQFTGGGIYVEGAATVKLTPGGTSTSQVYTITQGSTTTTITVDTAANTTVMSSGGTNLTISGVPSMRDSTGAALSSATMLYVNGNITSLSGPGEGQPAVNDGTALTITSAANVTITGDILYKTQPVTTSQNQIAGTPADTLIPGNNKGQVLGIFTAGGDIRIDDKQTADTNIEIDASLATISAGGSGSLVNTGESLNYIRVVGGRIQNKANTLNAATRDIFFDRRFASNNFAPPFFPATTITSTTVTTTDTASAIPTFQRTRWLNMSSTY